MEIFAHRLVADLCVEMAQSVYEECATRYPQWHAQNLDRAAFVRQCAPTLREHARRTLAELLGRPDISDAEKREIYEGLMLDSTLPRSGVFSVGPGGQLH